MPPPLRTARLLSVRPLVPRSHTTTLPAILAGSRRGPGGPTGVVRRPPPSLLEKHRFTWFCHSAAVMPDDGTGRPEVLASTVGLLVRPLAIEAPSYVAPFPRV